MLFISQCNKNLHVLEQNVFFQFYAKLFKHLIFFVTIFFVKEYVWAHCLLIKKKAGKNLRISYRGQEAISISLYLFICNSWYVHEVRSAAWLRPGKECCPPIPLAWARWNQPRTYFSSPAKTSYHNITRSLMGLRVSLVNCGMKDLRVCFEIIIC